jgi:large subunit ribosomal protein L43
MSLRGIRQLKELSIRYSDLDGSSRGIRAWMQQKLVKFAAANPQLAISTEKRRNRHPCLTGRYVNGNTKVIGIKNLEVDEINEQVLHLRNQIGRKMAEGYKKQVMSKLPSIQGQWHFVLLALGWGFLGFVLAALILGKLWSKPILLAFYVRHPVHRLLLRPCLVPCVDRVRRDLLPGRQHLVIFFRQSQNAPNSAPSFACK